MFIRLRPRPGTRDQRASEGRDRNRPPAGRLSVEPLEDRCLMAGDVVLDWNDVALEATRVAGNPPPMASRTMAIVHAAVYDSVNAIDRTFAPYFVDAVAPSDTSREAAAAAAAHRALVNLYPAQAGWLGQELAESLTDLPGGTPVADGVALGVSVADAIFAWRTSDGSNQPVAYTPGSSPGDWQRTPPAFAPALLPHWGGVTPFTMTSGDQFGLAGPPALTSPEYAAAFNEIKELGAVNSTVRTAEQTQIAKFWADSSVSHWNQIAANVSEAQSLTLSQNARLFALMNLATADAYIASWQAKYEFDFWRPVTAIRAADTDGNPETAADPNWTPLVVTPPMPAYSSGHATFGGAAAVTLAAFFGTDAVAFDSTSDILPGVMRSFASFSEAADENARSRLLAGIHWTFDNIDGVSAGRALGQYVAGNFLRPVDQKAAAGVLNGRLIVVGTDGADVLDVRREGDGLAVWATGARLGVFVGGFTSLVVDARGGDDVVLLAPQVDTDAELRGGAGNDLLAGGGGDDRVFGGDGRDVLLGCSGHDLLDGGAGCDILFGGPGGDELYGGLGDDWLFGGPGVDVLDGGPGRDRLFP